MSTVPLHPEGVPGRPGALRWVVPEGLLPASGEPVDAPGPFGMMIRLGWFARIEADRSGLLLELREGLDWEGSGDAVRRALGVALLSPAEWIVQPLVGGTPAVEVSDERLRAAALRVLAGAGGELIRSHGGTAEVVDVRDGVVSVRLDGACHGCPAADSTLLGRIEAGILRDVPTARCRRVP